MPSSYTFSVTPRPNVENQQLLPHVVDRISRSEPDAIWGEVPASSSRYDAGFKSITWRAFGNAINGLAHLIDAQFEKAADFEALGYFGPSDPRYPMLVLAGMKTGFKLFLSSPRNSIAGHRSLFEGLKCRRVLTTSPPPAHLRAVQSALPYLQIVCIPDLNSLLSTEYPQYPFDKTYKVAKDDPVLCLHTSGSTGLPKPIIYTHAYITAAVNNSQLEPPDGFTSLNQLIAGNRCILFLPLYHIAGMYFSMFMSIMNRNTIIFPLANSPPTGASLGSMLDNVAADWAFLAPMHVEEVAKDSNLIQQVASNLSMVLYSGGSLPPEIGNKVASHLRLYSYLGSSEFAGFPHLLPTSGDPTKNWAYIHLHPYIVPEFQSDDANLAELVIRRDPAYELWQTPFYIYSNVQEYRTKDIFEAHPALPNTWAHRGRKDDIVVFLNGEKTNPTTYQAEFREDPEISAALVFGDQRSEAGVLIELNAMKPLHEVSPELITRIYRIIDGANANTPAHARISKSHMIFGSPEKPFLRAPKGTVQRQATLDLYAPEVNELYQSIECKPPLEEANGSINDRFLGLSTSVALLEDLILEHYKLSTETQLLTKESNFFEAGLDSLQAIRLARALNVKLKRSDIDPDSIYSNPSPQRLARALKSGATGVYNDPVAALPQTPMERVFVKYSAYMEILASNSRVCSKSERIGDRKHTVLLTGSTGFLGAHLLAILTDVPNVTHIYCLNRQPVTNTYSRVTNLVADMSKPESLGLPSEVYQDLFSSVTMILHAAWPVNFHQPLEQFGPILAATAHLLVLAGRAPLNPSFIYISSESAVIKSAQANVTIPSTLLIQPPAASPNYGESKAIAERLVDEAAKTLGVRSGIARIGQICGPRRVQGRWNAKEWLPRLIQTSRNLGYIPKSLGGMLDIVNWVPVDEVAMIIWELADSVDSRPTTSMDGPAVFNVINPTDRTWGNVLEELRHTLKAKPLTGEEWLQQLQELEQKFAIGELGQEELLEKYPAVLLQHFYRERFDDVYPLRMDTRNTEVAILVAIVVWVGLVNLQSSFSATVLEIIHQPGLQNEIVSSLANAKLEDLDAFQYHSSSAWNQLRLRSAAFESIRLGGRITGSAHIYTEDVTLRSDPTLTLPKGRVATLSAFYTHRQQAVWGANADRYVSNRFAAQDPPISEPNFIAFCCPMSTKSASEIAN